MIGHLTANEPATRFRVAHSVQRARARLMKNELQGKFRALYARDPQVYRAPGRVNLIGEHTDYNDGFVMPVAIDFYTWVAIAPRADRKVVVRSENFEQQVEFDLDEPDARRRGHWSDYVCGVARLLDETGHRLCGADLLIQGEVPLGSGLSSSAAIEVATGYALAHASGIAVDRVELAQICLRAENEFVGLRCGIMDQFICCCGRSGYALMLDCRSLDYRHLRLPLDVSLVIANSLVKHAHASGEYNRRREECERAVEGLSRRIPQIRALRDVTQADLARCGSSLPEVIYRRARHVVTENGRVEEAAGAIERGDVETFGRLMGESHRSLRDDYEVSCPELDLLVNLAGKVDGVLGARMTGGGFGGCTVNLIRTASIEEFRRRVVPAYAEATGHTPEIYISPAAEGAGAVMSDEF